MATSTTYIPIQIWSGKNENLMSYEIFKQHYIGNLMEAQKKTIELRKEFKRPNYIVRRNDCVISIYKK